MDLLYTTHDISRLLQVDPSTVSKWIDRQMLLAFKTPGGHRRIRAADLRAFLIAHEMPLPDELGSSRVLLVVVDNEKAVLDSLKRALKPHSGSIDLLTTTSGVEALYIVAERRPHGMLIDLSMPEIDGIEVVRRTRARKPLEGMRLITMTSARTPQVVKSSLEAGADACLGKPVQVDSLLELFRVPLAFHQPQKR